MPGYRRIDLEKMNNEIIFRKAFILYKNKFQGPKSYIAQMCENTQHSQRIEYS